MGIFKMNDSDKQRFAQVMVGIAELYEKKPSKELMRLYFTALADYDIDAVVDAFSRHVNDPDQGMFMPKPAHIVKLIDGNSEENELHSKTKAELQWAGSVMKAMKELGSYGSPKFKDPITAAAINRIGGWLSICHCDTESMKWKQRDFINAYSDIEKVNDPHLLENSQVTGITGTIEQKQNAAAMLEKLEQGALQHGTDENNVQ